MQNKNIWMFNHYAQGPDLPGGTRHYDLAIELAKQGYNVSIFCSGFHHSLLKDIVCYNKNGFYQEVKDDINFIWVKTFPYKLNNWRRMLNIISYAFKLNNIIPKLNLATPKYIIGSTVHPFSPIIALKFARKFKSKYFFEIRDLWPQTYIDMKLWKKTSIVARFFKYLEKISVKYSDKIIVLSPLTIGYLKKEYNYNKKRVLLLPNGVNKSYINKKGTEISSKKINITYLGGIESVHGLEFMVDLAEKTNHKDIEFNIYGEGREKSYLKAKTLKNNINNIVWHNAVPKKVVPEILAKANLLFVSTSNVLYGSENKLYDYMASAKPIVLAIRGDHNNPIKEIGCGISLDRDDVSKSSLDLVNFVVNEHSNFKSLGKKGQDYVIKNRTIDLLTNQLVRFIKE